MFGTDPGEADSSDELLGPALLVRQGATFDWCPVEPGQIAGLLPPRTKRELGLGGAWLADLNASRSAADQVNGPLAASISLPVGGSLAHNENTPKAAGRPGRQRGLPTPNS